jgi:hypothetical protein
MLKFDLEVGRAESRRAVVLMIHAPVFNMAVNAWEARVECNDAFIPDHPAFGATALQPVENAMTVIRTLAASLPADEPITLDGRPFVIREDDRIY